MSYYQLYNGPTGGLSSPAVDNDLGEAVLSLAVELYNAAYCKNSIWRLPNSSTASMCNGLLHNLYVYVKTIKKHGADRLSERGFRMILDELNQITKYMSRTYVWEEDLPVIENIKDRIVMLTVTANLLEG